MTCITPDVMTLPVNNLSMYNELEYQQDILAICVLRGVDRPIAVDRRSALARIMQVTSLLDEHGH